MTKNRDLKKCRTCVRFGAKSCRGLDDCTYERMTDSDPRAKPTKRRRPTKKQVEAIDRCLQGWYGIGWGVDPGTLTAEDAVKTVMALACAAHVTWHHQMRTGRAPGEDVSPAEGLYAVAAMLEHCAKKARVRQAKCADLMKGFVDRHRDYDRGIVRKICERCNEAAPGYFDIPGDRGDK